MSPVRFTTFFIFFVIALGLNAQVKLNIDVNQERTAISENLMGVFFEDINYAADGGLYAELIQNRSFEYYPVSGYTSMPPLTAWALVKENGANATMRIDDTESLNTNNTKYLRLSINSETGKAGIRNAGFDGMVLRNGERYNFSVYLKRDSHFDQPLEVRLENNNGSVIGSALIDNTSATWTQYELELSCTETSYTGTLSLITSGAGTVDIDMVSLFPQKTFKNRKNGLRPDLAQAIADVKPQFLRFPGGCISHGRGLDNAYRWKHTVGDVAERKPNWNLWGYHQTYGLGFFEYFQFAEDIGAMPLPVVPMGVSCQFREREICAIGDMGMWIDDALDLVEFANGDVNTKWGAVRAQMGHPEPFNMEYICLGNEEDDIPEFRERFMMITDSLRKYYPEIKIIGTSGVDDTGAYYHSLWEFSRHHHLDAVDEHYYNDPEWFLNNVHRYDNFDRNGPKVFIGEYASRDDRHFNAIAEAAYLTGVERNADVIEFACYAPMLSNVNHQQWHPDMIRFDNKSVVKTASYYVQQLYSVNTGDFYLKSQLSYNEGFDPASTAFEGSMGLGTWNTQARFDDIQIVSGGQVIYEEQFNEGTGEWQVLSGSFSINDESYVQTSNAEPALSRFSAYIDSSEYTITLKAMKTGGREGFLIPFAMKDANNYYWFNIAGWANTQHAVEQVVNGSKNVLYTSGGSIQNNRWYTIKIDVNASGVSCWLDKERIFDIPAPSGPVTASVLEDTESNDLIVKLVNSGDQTIQSTINIEGINIDQQAKLTTMSGAPDVRNSISSPNNIVPEVSGYRVANTFNYTLPPYSFHVFRINKANGSWSSIKDMKKKNESMLKIVPNPSDGFTQIYFDNPHSEAFDLYLYDTMGQLMLQKLNTKNNSFTIEESSLPSGIYLVSVKSKDRDYTGRLVMN